MSTDECVGVDVRAVTDEEVEAFAQNHWVKLPGLIGPEVAAQLLETAKQLMGAEGVDVEPRPGVDFDTAWWKDFHDPGRESELFRSLTLSREMGRNSARLLGRDCPVRFMSDQLAVKPAKTKSGEQGKTDFHQDQPMPFDQNRVGFWIALDEVLPEQGSLRYYEGAHKLGLLGHLPLDAEKQWPRLAQCPLSEPLHLLPGDATAHSSMAVHGAPANLTDRTRWGFISVYFPGDAEYTNVPYPSTDGLGLVPGEPLDHPNFPIVYAPDGWTAPEGRERPLWARSLR